MESLTFIADEYNLLQAMQCAIQRAEHVARSKKHTTQKERVGIFVTLLRQRLCGCTLSKEDIRSLLNTNNWVDIGVMNSERTHFCTVQTKAYFDYKTGKVRQGYANLRIADLTPRNQDNIMMDRSMKLQQLEMLATLARERANENPERQLEQSFTNAITALRGMQSLTSEAETINLRAEAVVRQLCTIAENLA